MSDRREGGDTVPPVKASAWPKTRTRLLVAACAAIWLGCKRKENEAPISIPPPQGAASPDELSTAIGQARSVSSTLAPTSTRWRRTFVIDDKRAVITGELETEAVALVTGNAGRTWRSLRRQRDGWSAWSVGESGAAVLAVGPRAEPLPSKDPHRFQDGGVPEQDPTEIFFAPFDANELTAPSALALPMAQRGARPPVNLAPAVLSTDHAALVVEESPGRSVLVYAGFPGAEPIPPLQFPREERVLPVPYGRPPSLFSTRGRSLLVRPVPAPRQPLDPPQVVSGLSLSPAAVAALSAPPACEIAGTSIQLVPQPAGKSAVVAVSGTQTTVFTLPAMASPGASLGCGAGTVSVEVADPKSGAPTLLVCTLDASCTLAEKPPFRAWLEPHERSVVSVQTREGAVAVLTARTAGRWGLYMTMSTNGGKIYEVPRVIGEGTGERGRIELGALLSFGDRLLILLQADVTGTSQRGWYAAISGDGGLTWSPP